MIDCTITITSTSIEKEKEVKHAINLLEVEHRRAMKVVAEVMESMEEVEVLKGSKLHLKEKPHFRRESIYLMLSKMVK